MEGAFTVENGRLKTERLVKHEHKDCFIVFQMINCLSNENENEKEYR